MGSLDKQKKKTLMKIKRKRESARNAVDRSEEECEMRFIKRYI